MESYLEVKSFTLLNKEIYLCGSSALISRTSLAILCVYYTNSYKRHYGVPIPSRTDSTKEMKMSTQIYRQFSLLRTRLK